MMDSWFYQGRMLRVEVGPPGGAVGVDQWANEHDVRRGPLSEGLTAGIPVRVRFREAGARPR